MSELIPSIRPELLAAKIEKLENFELPAFFDELAEEPRLFRALWFLQWVSQPTNHAGGLTKFAAELIEANRDYIGTARMVKRGGLDSYELKDAVEIFGELPSSVRDELFESNTYLFEAAFLPGAAEEIWNNDKPADRESARREHRKEWTPLFLAKLRPSTLRSILCAHAANNLASYFKELCELQHTVFGCSPKTQINAPWYFGNVTEALLEFIEGRATALSKRIAQTEITQLVSRWTAKSRNTRRPVMIVGNSRFGKTEAVKLTAESHPGSCRLVNTPATNAMSDLLREVAKSLGLEVGPGSAGHALRERIDYVLRFSHLQLIFDESQLLLPAQYSRNTAPARLNWVRRSIMDQNIAAVFICTPQSYLPAKKRFMNTTGFAMEQFDERILKTVHLPEELSESDLLAVARIHFDDLADEYLRFVVETVLATERNFVSDIEKIATLAKDNAREHGRKRATLADIEAAIADVLSTIKTALPTQKTLSKPSIQKPCKRLAQALPTRCNNVKPWPIPNRETQPLEVTA
jgi:hypothetical protein